MGDSEIAIIGMSCRFPGASSVEMFWQNLRAGVESIAVFSDEELLEAGVAPDLLSDPNFVKAGTVLPDIELFDAAFFGFSPREAQILDPQQRLFLECAHAAIEHAGYASDSYRGAIGVYAGVGMSFYLLENIYSNRALMESIGAYQMFVSNDKDFLPTRVAYKLNLKGPAVTVQTACSTSLVAVHLACQSLLNGECDIALAGGVSIALLQKQGYLYQEGMILSPDGHCRAFDAQANGTIASSGLGIVVLKGLEEALDDGDTIHAVIRGSAINNDGAAKVGYTAPSIEGQVEVIREALAVAEVEPDAITYIETHGTGTVLGDPIEMAALSQVFQTSGNGAVDDGSCAIGSVKTNIGHTDTAAGVASLIKATLALEHKQIPPNLNFETPNPKIDFANSPFYVNTALQPWRRNGGRTTHRRHAGVSSFGVGGTNAHVILEEAPASEPSNPSRPWQLLLLSAKTPSALDTATENLATHLKQHPDINLADVAHTLQVGRRVYPYRRMLVCQCVQEAISALQAPEHLLTSVHEAGERPIAFMFSGQGAQYVNMTRELYEQEPGFRETIDTCARLLESHLGLDIRHLLYPGETQVEEATRQVAQTVITQPALFVIEYALAQLWQEWGVQPQAMIGHSIGEYVAACLAGVFVLEDALALVARRGQLMQSLPTGAMLAVHLSEAELTLPDGISLAAVNGPALCVVSGTVDAVNRFQEQLTQQNVECRQLHTSRAFHSAMMDPILEAFTEQVRAVDLQPPRLPYISNVSGTWITVEEATDPSYWASHLRQTVRFAQGLDDLHEVPDLILLEIGPGRTLSTFAKQHPNGSEQVVLHSTRHPRETQSDLALLFTALGQLWLAGGSVNWSGFYAYERRHRIPLPTYPFERQRYWIDPPKTGRWPYEQKVEKPVATPSSQEDRPQSSMEGQAFVHRQHNTPYVAPRTEIEQIVASIFQELLGFERISINDDFWDLNGHSLLATQLISQIQQTAGVSLPLSAVFESPTVAGLSAAIESVRQTQTQDGLQTKGSASTQTVDATPWMPLLPMQIPVIPPATAVERAYVNSGWQFSIRTEVDTAALKRACTDLAARHEALRVRVAERGGTLMQQIQPNVDVPFKVVDASGWSQEELVDQVTRIWQYCFDLEQEPPIRVTLFTLAPNEHILVLLVHHIVADGWSIKLMRNELPLLYQAQASGRDVELPELLWSFTDTLRWLQTMVAGAEGEELLHYWQQRLSKIPSVLNLPTDYPRPSLPSHRGTGYEFWLSPDLTQQLQQLAQEKGMPLPTIVQAGFHLLLHQLSGQDDVLVGMTVNNRVRPELEHVVGSLVDAVPLRSTLAKELPFSDYLSQVRATVRDALAHQGYPSLLLAERLCLDSLSELLEPRSLTRVSLNYFHAEILGTQHPDSLAKDSLHTLRLETCDLPVPMIGNWEEDFIITIYEEPEQLRGLVRYSTDLFTEATIAQMTETFQTLLKAIVEDPEQSVLTLVQQPVK